MKQITNFIAGTQQPPIGGSYLDVVEPATGDVYAQCPASTEADVDAAVEAAKSAFPAWSATPAQERSRIMLQIADLIERKLGRLAEAESRDTGKPISVARSVDIPRAAANFRFFATAILHSETAAHDSGDALNYTLRRPRGVAGLISPWNLPLYLFTWKIAPAIAAGNTAVGKPSEITPYTAFLFGELCAEAGLPAGVLNIVLGNGADAGTPLVAHTDVPTISFTGGTETGRAIAKTCAETFKRVSLELGGKNPNLIFADADMEQAIPEAVRAAFSNQGQICLCGSRILIERSAYDAFVARFVERAGELRVGDPSDPETKVGALVSAEHLAKVDGYVALARRLGGEILCGGGRADPESDRCRAGSFYEPTVIAGLEPTCAVMQEEIFGPVVTVTPFEDEAEAIAIANGTPFGLASMVWTSDLSRAHRVASKIDAGIVWVNCWMKRDLRTPFGGMKQSGLGREGGWDALKFFTEPKNICISH